MIATDATIEALLKAVYADPTNLDVRLVLADAIEEAGDQARAEFIRNGVEMERCPSCTVEGKVVNWQKPMRACRDVFPDPHDGKGHGPHCQPCWIYTRHRRRANELRNLHESSWLPFRTRRQSYVENEYGNGLRYPRITWHAGFVSRVECRLEQWIGEVCHHCRIPPTDLHAPFESGPCPKCHGRKRLPGIGAMLRDHPVREVATEKRPDSDGAALGDVPSFWWEPGYSYDMPHQIPMRMCEWLEKAGHKASFINGLMVYKFDTEAAALSALSDTLIALVRKPS